MNGCSAVAAPCVVAEKNPSARHRTLAAAAPVEANLIQTPLNRPDTVLCNSFSWDIDSSGVGPAGINNDGLGERLPIQPGVCVAKFETPAGKPLDRLRIDAVFLALNSR